MLDKIIFFLNSKTVRTIMESGITITIMGLLLTYLFAYWTNKFPKIASQKYEISKYRLNNVLLPLQKLFLFSPPKGLTQPNKINKINTIYKRHLEYVTPAMQEIIKDLNRSINYASDETSGLLKLLSDLTNHEYEIVRSELKLPTQKPGIVDPFRIFFRKKTYSLSATINFIKILLSRSFIFFYTILIIFVYLGIKNPIILTILSLLLLAAWFSLMVSLIFYLYYKMKQKFQKLPKHPDKE